MHNALLTCSPTAVPSTPRIDPEFYLDELERLTDDDGKEEGGIETDPAFTASDLEPSFPLPQPPPSSPSGSNDGWIDLKETINQLASNGFIKQHFKRYEEQIEAYCTALKDQELRDLRYGFFDTVDRLALCAFIRCIEQRRKGTASEMENYTLENAELILGIVGVELTQPEMRRSVRTLISNRLKKLCRRISLDKLRREPPKNDSEYYEMWYRRANGDLVFRDPAVNWTKKPYDN